MKGKLFVISGPSGCGKSTIIGRVRQAFPSLGFSVSATTRAIRPNETDGKDYFFISREDFETMLARGELLEHNEYAGNFYGTPITPIRDAIAKGETVLLDIDPNGAANVKTAFPDAILVYITPPSAEELERRLRSRGDTSEKQITERLARAEWEKTQIDRYDHVVINDDLDEAVKRVVAILSERFC